MTGIPWILNSTIGNLKVMVYTQFILPEIATPTDSYIHTASVPLYWEEGETKEGSMCACPTINNSQVQVQDACCNTFDLIGKSGNHYQMTRTAGSNVLTLAVGGTSYAWWTGFWNNMIIPELYLNGKYVGHRMSMLSFDPGSIGRSYDASAVQPESTKAGYIVLTAKTRLGGSSVSFIYGDGEQSSNAYIKALYDILQGGKPQSSDPYDNLPTGGDQPIPGGDNIPEPGFPSLSATSTGIVGLFCPSVSQMQQLADFMWTDFGGQGTTVIEVLEEVVEALKRTISNPLDYIFGLNMIPSQGLNIGGSKVVKFGFVSSGVSMPILADHYFRVNCGSLSFGTLCGDSFLDYAPYSKFSIYLPYIGFKDLDPNDLVGHTISVVYHGDAITGGLTAYILKDGNIMYQYSGGCALNIPLSSDNWGATVAAAASVATGVLSAAAVPGAAGVAGAGKALLKGAASNVASNPSLLSPQVMHSGAVTGSPGFMGVQYPFIIREAVNFHSTDGFNKSSGYPAYYYRKLGDVTGYTTVMDAHMANIPMATQEEIEEIENLLESGVIL